MALINCDRLAVGYNGVSVAEDITFSLEEGQMLCIVGNNGVGKSTLIKTLLGLTPPLSGKVELGDGLLRRQIGYLPQRTLLQTDFPASALEVVLSGCLGKRGSFPFYSREHKALARQNMALLSISELEKKSYTELSGGQRQRVLLARALCATERLLVLDEPVTALDPKVTEEMYAAVSELNRGGLTVIMISHDISAAIKYSTHVLHMAHRPKFFGRTEDYLKSDASASLICGGDGK